ncbi:MAG: nicotinate (nicotinamide) nucleotide adenylyltransferase [Ilumatobacteraceae bacterium]|nr:nicotinate (nicotinamide) nucleotide adenylyltransferase [Ilumatobacteraceae bacterium]
MTGRLGIFGGTFDPPHVGHVVAALNVRHALGLDMVTLMVAGEPWQKTSEGNVESAGDRLAMTRAAVAGISGLNAGDDEVLRSGPTYTVDTLEKILQMQPDTELFTIVGADAARGISTWHRWQDIALLSTLVVVNRDTTTLVDVNNFASEHVMIANIDVSSSEIRRRIGQGQSVDHLVSPAVLAIIKQYNLYHESNNDTDYR